MKAFIVVACFAAGTLSTMAVARAENAAQAEGKDLKQESKQDKAAARDAARSGDKADAKVLRKQAAQEKKAGKVEEKAGNRAER